MQTNGRTAAVTISTAEPLTVHDRKHRFEVWLYYVEYIGFTIFEGALIAGIKWFASWTGVRGFGSWLCWILFSLGGWILGYLQRCTPVGESRWNPLQWACSMQRHFGNRGTLFNSVFFGSIGACIALEHTNEPRRRRLYPVTGLVFSSAWVPFLLFLEPAIVKLF